MARAAILDVDGTLVDSVYQHALCWQRAFARCGIVVPAWRCHRAIGMGGDQLVAELAGSDAEREHGEELREAEGELFDELIDEVRPLDGAVELITELADRGLEVVLASSAKQDDVEHYLDLLEASGRIAGYTTAADVEQTKPDPDLVESALSKAGTRDAVMVGDSTWDIEAAGRAGIECLGVLCGGFSESELRDAGAIAVYRSPAELREQLDGSPLIS